MGYLTLIRYGYFRAFIYCVYTYLYFFRYLCINAL